MRTARLWLTLCAAVLLPLLAVLAVQATRAPASAERGVQVLREARVLVSDAATPPADLASAPLRRLPLNRAADQTSALWLAIPLPAAGDRSESLALSYRPGLTAFLDGRPLAAGPGDASGTGERFVLGNQRWVLELLPGLHRQQPAQTLQLRLAAPGPSGASLEAPLLGPPAAVQALDSGRRHWQLLRAATALGGVLVAAFLALVARTRRDEPIYALSALHVALLALLLSPYVLVEQPLPSPWWRMLLDAGDLGAKLLLVVICARLAYAWTPPLRRLLWIVAVVGLPLDLAAAALGWPWSRFDHAWPWWALGSRALLFALAWGLALRALRDRGTPATWGTALLVGFSAATWAWVSLSVLVLGRPVVDANALAHAGWVAWVALLLLRHFNDGARRERQLRERLSLELEQRRRELETVFAAHAQAERERAASEQRRRLLQDLHDGLGARLLSVRLRAPELDAAALAEALDDCLLEMRLSVDTLAQDDGDLGVLLGSWRQRIEPVLRSAQCTMDWRVAHAPHLPCLRGGGALELVRGLQELTSNALRHGGARRLIVATEADDQAVTVWLVDDGAGMADNARPGQGRRSVMQRAERLGGAVSWHSPAPSQWETAGPGTAVAWRLPIRQ
jgi:signal transduction histidine kinase